MNLKEALAQIKELELENARLREIISEYESKNTGGRKKHDAKWQNSYNTFVQMYEDGYSMIDIVEKSEFSKRTAYRYKEFYDNENPDKKRFEKKGRKVKMVKGDYYA